MQVNRGLESGADVGLRKLSPTYRSIRVGWAERSEAQQDKLYIALGFVPQPNLLAAGNYHISGRKAGNNPVYTTYPHPEAQDIGVSNGL